MYAGSRASGDSDGVCCSCCHTPKCIPTDRRVMPCCLPGWLGHCSSVASRCTLRPFTTNSLASVDSKTQSMYFSNLCWENQRLCYTCQHAEYVGRGRQTQCHNAWHAQLRVLLSVMLPKQACFFVSDQLSGPSTSGEVDTAAVTVAERLACAADGSSVRDAATCYFVLDHLSATGVSHITYTQRFLSPRHPSLMHD